MKYFSLDSNLNDVSILTPKRRIHRAIILLSRPQNRLIGNDYLAKVIYIRSGFLLYKSVLGITIRDKPDGGGGCGYAEGAC